MNHFLSVIENIKYSIDFYEFFFIFFSRFNGVKYYQYNPVNSLSNATHIKFHVPPATGTNIHLIQNMVLQVQVRLRKKAGGPIDKELVLAPVNNIMSSLFRSTCVKINNTSITKNSDSIYPDYLKKLISYGYGAKNSHLQSSGWYEDSGMQFDPIGKMDDNAGFMARQNLFRTTDNPNNVEYHDRWVTFTGTLHHDLKSSEVGIPPGVTIDVELETTTNNFRLMCTTPEPDAILEIGECSLHVPRAEMNETLFRSLHDQWQTTPIQLFHTRTVVSKVDIPIGSRTFFSNEIFKGNDTKPCRCFFFFLINEQQYPSNMSTNPYKFVRRFFDTKKGIWVYVEQFEMRISGNEMDSLTTKATLDDDPVSFLRFNQVCNTDTSPRDNAITYANWMDNTSIFAFDLSSSGKCQNEFWVPTLLAGHASIKVTFNSELPYGITLCCLQELPSLSTIDKDGRILHSFFSGVA